MTDVTPAAFFIVPVWSSNSALISVNLPISVLVEPFNGPVHSTNHLFWLPTLSFQSSDLYLETLDNLRGMLGLTRRFSFCLLDCQLQLGYLLCQAVSCGFEIV